MADIVDTARVTAQQTARSTQLFDEAKQLIPGGVNNPVRAFRGVGGTPRFIDSTQHGAAEVERTLQAARDTFAEMSA